MFVTVRIDSSVLLKMLMRRVNDWFVEPEELALFRSMYERYIENWYFQSVELDVNAIVDNDCVNYCTVIRKGDADYALISELYTKCGIGDISCENSYGYSCIEAAVDGCFLVRCSD